MQQTPLSSPHSAIGNLDFVCASSMTCNKTQSQATCSRKWSRFRLCNIHDVQQNLLEYSSANHRPQIFLRIINDVHQNPLPSHTQPQVIPTFDCASSKTCNKPTLKPTICLDFVCASSTTCNKSAAYNGVATQNQYRNLILASAADWRSCFWYEIFWQVGSDKSEYLPRGLSWEIKDRDLHCWFYGKRLQCKVHWIIGA